MGNIFQRWLHTPTRGELRAAQMDEITQEDIEKNGRGGRSCSLRGDKCMYASCDYDCPGRKDGKLHAGLNHDGTPISDAQRRRYAPRGDIVASAVHAVDGTVTSGRSKTEQECAVAIHRHVGITDAQVEAAAEAIARAMPVGFIVTMEAAREFARAALEAARSVKP